MFRLWPGCSDCGLRLLPRMLILMLRHWPRMLRLRPGWSDCDLDAQIVAREWLSQAPNYLKMLTIPWLEDRRSWTDLSVSCHGLNVFRQGGSETDRKKPTDWRIYLSLCHGLNGVLWHGSFETDRKKPTDWRIYLGLRNGLGDVLGQGGLRPADSDLRKPTDLMISRSLCHGLNCVWTKRFCDRY